MIFGQFKKNEGAMYGISLRLQNICFVNWYGSLTNQVILFKLNLIYGRRSLLMNIES